MVVDVDYYRAYNLKDIFTVCVQCFIVDQSLADFKNSDVTTDTERPAVQDAWLLPFHLVVHLKINLDIINAKNRLSWYYYEFPLHLAQSCVPVNEVSKCEFFGHMSYKTESK